MVLRVCVSVCVYPVCNQCGQPRRGKLAIDRTSTNGNKLQYRSLTFPPPPSVRPNRNIFKIFRVLDVYARYDPDVCGRGAGRCLLNRGCWTRVGVVQKVTYWVNVFDGLTVTNSCLCVCPVCTNRYLYLLSVVAVVRRVFCLLVFVIVNLLTIIYRVKTLCALTLSLYSFNYDNQESTATSRCTLY